MTGKSFAEMILAKPQLNSNGACTYAGKLSWHLLTCGDSPLLPVMSYKTSGKNDTPCVRSIDDACMGLSHWRKGLAEL